MAKALIITDDEEGAVEDMNPFSFREFLRWKSPQEGSEFFSEPSLATQDQEEDWSAVDTSICTEAEETELELEEKENYEGDDETSTTEPEASSGRSHMQELKEENLALKKTIMELKNKSQVNERRALSLSDELAQRRRQEEREAEDLESMVHSVELNLKLMTKRAVKAESSVSKLKVDLQQLQVELDSLRLENNSLKAAESEVVTTMRQNAKMAAEYLNKSTSQANNSIRQLMGEAESLLLVSKLLQSIDKISTVDT